MNLLNTVLGLVGSMCAGSGLSFCVWVWQWVVPGDRMWACMPEHVTQLLWLRCQVLTISVNLWCDFLILDDVSLSSPRPLNKARECQRHRLPLTMHSLPPVMCELPPSHQDCVSRANAPWTRIWRSGWKSRDEMEAWFPRFQPSDVVLERISAEINSNFMNLWQSFWVQASTQNDTLDFFRI